jgi:hypothetical protein
MPAGMLRALRAHCRTRHTHCLLVIRTPKWPFSWNVRVGICSAGVYMQIITTPDHGKPKWVSPALKGQMTSRPLRAPVGHVYRQDPTSETGRNADSTCCFRISRQRECRAQWRTWRRECSGHPVMERVLHEVALVAGPCLCNEEHNYK